MRSISLTTPLPDPPSFLGRTNSLLVRSAQPRRPPHLSLTVNYPSLSAVTPPRLELTVQVTVPTQTGSPSPHPLYVTNLVVCEGFTGRPHRPHRIQRILGSPLVLNLNPKDVRGYGTLGTFHSFKVRILRGSVSRPQFLLTQNLYLLSHSFPFEGRLRPCSLSYSHPSPRVDPTP